jgi:RimJ/RimL family protein N-acetyltransferase
MSPPVKTLRQEILTTRLALTPLSPADSRELHALWTHPAVRQYLWDDIVIPREQTDGIVRLSQKIMRRSGHGLWAAREKVDRRLVGFGGYWLFPNRADYELLYGVGAPGQGRGLGTELAGAMIAHGFDNLKLAVVHASTDFPNRASIRVLEKLGFRQTKREMTGGLDTLHYELSHSAIA